MAEALLRQIGGDRFKAASAGVSPAMVISSVASETMRQMGVPMDGQYSKGWDDLADDPPEIVITVCDHAASQPCPSYAGRLATAHWSLPDPSFFAGTDEQRLAFARFVAEKLRTAIEQLVALPIEQMTPGQVWARLQELAPDASGFRPPPA
jgi:arsenate reductase